MRTKALIFGICAAWLLAAPTTAFAYAGQAQFPPTDRAWTADDLPTAANAMRPLDASNLPRLNNDSRVVLERLSEPATLDVCNDRASPLTQRLQTCYGAFAAQVEILGFYMNAFGGDPARGDDCMRVAEAAVYGAGAMNLLMEEFIPTLDPNDPSYATRMTGVDQARRGLTEMIGGAITMMGERNLYSAAARARFATVIAQTYPKVASSMPAERRAAFEQSLRTLARSDPSAEIRAALGAFDR